MDGHQGVRGAKARPWGTDETPGETPEHTRRRRYGRHDSGAHRPIPGDNPCPSTGTKTTRQAQRCQVSAWPVPKMARSLHSHRKSERSHLGAIQLLACRASGRQSSASAFSQFTLVFGQGHIPQQPRGSLWNVERTRWMNGDSLSYRFPLLRRRIVNSVLPPVVLLYVVVVRTPTQRRFSTLTKLRIRSIDANQESERFTLGLRAALRKAEREFGDGYLNSVLVDLITDSDLTRHPEIAAVLKYSTALHLDREGRATSRYRLCRDMIADAIGARAHELRDDLGYTEEEAKPILVHSLAQYLDERFSVSSRRRLGLL